MVLKQDCSMEPPQTAGLDAFDNHMKGEIRFWTHTSRVLTYSPLVTTN
jgi:hypothetical protein